MEIYAYTNIGGNTIEVLSLPTVQTSCGAQCYRTWSTDPIEHRLLFRIELKENEKVAKRSNVTSTPRRRWLVPGRTSPSELTSSSGPPKRRRCFSVYGLFSMASVCRQTRADLQLLVYELNSFAFSDKHYNYSRAMRAFTKSLTERELSSIQAIHWPLVNVLAYRHNLRGEKVEEPDSTSVEELRNLPGLTRVVLRYGGPEFNSLADKPNEEERLELQGLVKTNGGWDYALEREFRRTMAARTARALIEREDVRIRCEKTWRAAF